MLGHQSAKRQFNGVSLAGQWWPAFVVFGSSFPSSTKKNVVKVGPPPSPGQNFLAGSHVLCAKPRPPRANKNSGGFDLRHHAVLETLSAADNNSWQFGPRSGPTKCLMFLLIKLCGAQADATSLVSYNKVGIHTSIDVWFWYVAIISRSSNFHSRKIHP